MQEGKSFLELRNQNENKTNCFINLSSALDIKDFYTLNKGDQKAAILINFTVDLAALEKVLDELS